MLVKIALYIQARCAG